MKKSTLYNCKELHGCEHMRSDTFQVLQRNHPSEKNNSSMSEWLNGSQMNEYALLLLGWYHGTTELAVWLGFRSWLCELLSKITHLNHHNIFWTHTKKQIIKIHFGGLFIICLCIYISICSSTYVCTHTMPPSWGKWRQYHHDRLIVIGKMRNWCNNVNTYGTCFWLPTLTPWPSFWSLRTYQVF